MNFLQEVLQSAETIDIEHIREKVPAISTTIADFKDDIERFFNDVYVTFKEWPRKSNKLTESATTLSNEVTELQQTIDYFIKRDISDTMTELNELNDELDKSNSCLNLITKIVKIHDSLSTIQQSIKANDFNNLTFELLTIHECFQGMPNKETMPALIALKCTALTTENEILMKMELLFHTNVVIEQHETNNVFTNTVKIRNETKTMQEILSSLILLDTPINMFLGKLDKFLCVEICQPIIEKTANVFTKSENGFNILAVVVKNNERPSYSNVFKELLEVFQFMYENFNFTINEDFTTINYLSDNLRDKLSDELINKCLSFTIPSKSEDLMQFDVVIKNTEEFQAKIIEFGVYTDSAPFVSYVNDVDKLFVENKCQEYITNATKIMKKDLHDILDVKDEDANNVIANAHFPKCSISRSVLELLDLAKEILDEISKNSDSIAIQLVNTIQDILYIYGTNTREFHRKFLETIPQHVALFYNNCMYLAFNLSKWNQSYTFSEKILPSPPIFKDQAHQLQTVGTQTLNNFVSSQIKVIEDIVEHSQLSSLQNYEALDPCTEKFVRQCLRQHELLKTVWQKVLPSSVYNKVVGSILNAFCNALIKCVLKIEDISSTTAEQLVEIYKVVLSRAPKLFHETEVSLHVNSWVKFSDLVFILEGSMVEIDNRWNDEKSSLAMHFKAEEIKKLIRALFQNTDRRAAVLNRIH